MTVAPADALVTAIHQAPRSRRRGAKLEDAIFDAVLDELGEKGLARLTFEGVAARAHTGKSALYRRWANMTVLVLDTMDARAPDGSDFVAGGNLRDDLINLVFHLTRGQDGPAGVALRALIGEAHRAPELFDALVERFLAPRYEAFEKVLLDAAERGDIDPRGLTRDAIEVIPALVMHRYLLNQGPMTAEISASWIDGILLPLIADVPAPRTQVGTARVLVRDE